MRPIDADALMDFYLMRPTEEFLYERQYTAEDVALKIENTPTMDTVKHGHWKDDIKGMSVFCSECEYVVWRETGTEYNYCSRCGAKMNEEVSE